MTTPTQALSGFASSEWIFVLLVLGNAAGVARSGLLFRLGLALPRRIPSGLFGQAAVLLFSGVLLSPLIPQTQARTGFTMPLALAVTEARGVQEQHPAAAVLGLAA